MAIVEIYLHGYYSTRGIVLPTAMIYLTQLLLKTNTNLYIVNTQINASFQYSLSTLTNRIIMPLNKDCSIKEVPSNVSQRISFIAYIAQQSSTKYVKSSNSVKSFTSTAISNKQYDFR